MLDNSIMGSRAVQISLEEGLLRRIDADPEARQAGRSAFIRSAAEAYLLARKTREVERAIQRAYAGQADDLVAEVEQLLGKQAWPKK